jgi:hypothetical protein
MSLGLYAVRVYGTWSDQHQQLINDLVHPCVAGLVPRLPPNSPPPPTSTGTYASPCTQIGEWKAKEIVKLKSLFALCSVSGALELYWKAMRLLLVPQLSPTRPPLCSLLWNSISHHNNGITSPFSTTTGVVSLQDIDHTLRVVIQLTDGGAELSDMKNLFRSKDSSRGNSKKSKRNKKNGSEEVESLPINDEDVANALLKLECLCEVDILPS